MAATIPAPLLGRSAIITGGSRGIGAAIAFEFARLGANSIAITYNSNKEAADGVLQTLESRHPQLKTVAIKADLLSPTFGEDVVHAASKDLKFKGLDILVNNAVIGGEYHEPFEAMTHLKWEKQMTANVWAPAQVIRAALPLMNSNTGRIINISSTSSKRPNPDPIMTYGMSKAALDSLTRSLAVKYAADKAITINSVSPGPTMTDMLKQASQADEQLKAQIMKGATAAHRVGEPEDVAEIIGFLAGPGARWINGNQIPANGGRVLDLQS